MVISDIYRNFALAFEKESNDGAIAQLVEQRTENPCVPGSIPGGTTQKRRNQIWLRLFLSYLIKHYLSYAPKSGLPSALRSLPSRSRG